MHGEEFLTTDEARSEEIMLQIRLASGITLDSLSSKESQALPEFLADGYLDRAAWEAGRLVLSATGRLVADRIVREILV